MKIISRVPTEKLQNYKQRDKRDVYNGEHAEGTCGVGVV